MFRYYIKKGKFVSFVLKKYGQVKNIYIDWLKNTDWSK